MKYLIVAVVFLTIFSLIWVAFRDAIDPNAAKQIPNRKFRKKEEWPPVGEDTDKLFWMIQVK